MDNLDNFTKSYLIAALWSSVDDNQNPLDDNYDISALEPSALKNAIDECQDFQSQYADLLEDIDVSQAGHDFWLTRNGHGTGFWDRDLGEIGEKLTEASKSYGEADLYVTDKNTIDMVVSKPISHSLR